SFRGWLFTLAHHRLYDLLARRRRLGQGSGDSGTLLLLAELPAREDEDLWHREYRQHVFARAAEQVRPTVAETTWQAFWQTAGLGKGGQEVADALGMTVAAVYLAKSRVMARLKEQVKQWEGE